MPPRAALLELVMVGAVRRGEKRSVNSRFIRSSEIVWLVGAAGGGRRGRRGEGEEEGWAGDVGRRRLSRLELIISVLA